MQGNIFNLLLIIYASYNTNCSWEINAIFTPGNFIHQIFFTIKYMSTKNEYDFNSSTYNITLKKQNLKNNRFPKPEPIHFMTSVKIMSVHVVSIFFCYVFRDQLPIIIELKLLVLITRLIILVLFSELQQCVERYY